MQDKNTGKRKTRPTKPVYSDCQSLLVDKMEKLRSFNRAGFDLTHKDVPLYKIATICADAWGCDLSIFTSKTNHKDYWQKEQKKSFFYAAYYFSNKAAEDIIYFAAYRGIDNFNWSKYLTNELTSRRTGCLILLEIITELAKITPKRLSSLISINYLNPQSDNLPIKDVSSILKKDRTWFLKNINKPIHVYHQDSGGVGKIIFEQHLDTSIIDHFQDAGYRFELSPECFSLDSLKGHLSNWGKTGGLTKYQISKIPVRPREWFVLKDTAKSLYIYHLSDNRYVFMLKHTFFADAEILFGLQDKEYRFVDYYDKTEGRDNYAERHPVCDRCLHAKRCLLKASGLFVVNYSCFEEIPNAPLKVPIELLLRPEQYQLQ